MILKSFGAILLILGLFLQGQELQFIDKEADKCGPYNEFISKALLKTLGDNWGYGYDDLLADLEIWKLSPFVEIDSIGASVEGRTLWELTISGPDSSAIGVKQIVFIHARTHPNEVQGWWVTNELIELLLSDTKAGKKLRNSMVFHIVPMYNPDGVELEYPRENAHGVDIESNWYSQTIEPEVLALRNRFEELMRSDKPIDIALNMHSSYRGERFFVCHDSTGTSPLYLDLEKRFIGEVRSGFLSGIEPWDYLVTWTGATALKYPESWFWLNHQESVMALTYEDNNSELAGAFDTTASAILQGIFKYLNPTTTSLTTEILDVPGSFSLNQNFPNPFNPNTSIIYNLFTESDVEIRIFDISGRTLLRHIYGDQVAGYHSLHWNGTDMNGRLAQTGIYFCRLSTAHYSQTIKMVLVK